MINFHQFRTPKFLRTASPVLLITLTFGLAACSSATEEVATEDVAEPVMASNLSEGWSVHADGGMDAGADNQMMTMADGSYHFTMGGPPAATGTFYNPAWTASGDHTFSATLTQNEKSTHPTSYGLMFGGNNLDTDDQMYSYFLVHQPGEYYIANRNGAESTAVVDWTANPAINPEAEDGTQSNTLSVQVAGDEVIFSVNGTEVDRLPAADLHTDGMYGFRIGHRLDVTVTDLMN